MDARSSKARGAPESNRDSAVNASTRRFESEGKKLFFIAHARADGDFAELVQSRIEKAGHRTWIDVANLTVGTDWSLEIDRTIRASAAAVLVMSPKAKASEYVTYEWAFALAVGTPVIPILLKRTRLHPRLERLQFLDFRNRAARPWDTLMNALAGTKHPRVKD
jgi:hypothetical protein